MKPDANPLAFSLTLILSLGLHTGCGGAPTPVDLTGNWPAAGSSDTQAYKDLTEQWTRRGQVLSTFSERKVQVISVFATLKSPEWQAAYVDFLTERQLLPPPEVQSLRKDYQDAEFIEVQMFASVDDPRMNNFARGRRNSWRVALVSDDGTETLPSEVLRDRRPPTLIRTEYPHYSELYTPYIVRFPKSAALFGPGQRRVAMKVGSARGAVELVWLAK